MALYNLEKEYYFEIFKQTAAEANALYYKDYIFRVEFEDACQSATILPQEIDFPTLTWSLDSNVAVKVAAFVDSVEGTLVLAGGDYYPIGICGEKEVTLDPDSPDFLTLTLDAVDP